VSLVLTIVNAWGPSLSHLQEVEDFANKSRRVTDADLPRNKSLAKTCLVVVLHGSMQSAANYDRGAGWSTLAERYGFALLMPEQSREQSI